MQKFQYSQFKIGITVHAEVAIHSVLNRKYSQKWQYIQ